jgi:hypothetical protein
LAEDPVRQAGEQISEAIAAALNGRTASTSHGICARKISEMLPAQDRMKQEPDTASPLAGVTGVSAYIISLSDHLASDSYMQALVVILAGTVKDFDLIRLCPIAVAF